MSLPGSRTDLELGALVNGRGSAPTRPEGCKSLESASASDYQSPPSGHQPCPPDETEGSGRGSAPTSGGCGTPASTGDRPTRPRDAVSGVKLLDTEIEALWSFTYRNQPCPGRDDETNRWKLLELAERYWTDEVAEITSRLDRAKDEASSTNNELYQIVGFYSVFQGLLVGAACQSNNVTCRSRIPLFVLCVIVTAYTIIGLWLKFTNFRDRRSYELKLQRQRNQRKAQITTLRRDNLGFEFAGPVKEKGSSTFRSLILPVSLVLAILAFSGVVIWCINWFLC